MIFPLCLLYIALTLFDSEREAGNGKNAQIAAHAIVIQIAKIVSTFLKRKMRKKGKIAVNCMREINKLYVVLMALQLMSKCKHSRASDWIVQQTECAVSEKKLQFYIERHRYSYLKCQFQMANI